VTRTEVWETIPVILRKAMGQRFRFLLKRRRKRSVRGGEKTYQRTQETEDRPQISKTTAAMVGIWGGPIRTSTPSLFRGAQGEKVEGGTKGKKGGRGKSAVTLTLRGGSVTPQNGSYRENKHSP